MYGKRRNNLVSEIIIRILNNYSGWTDIKVGRQENLRNLSVNYDVQKRLFEILQTVLTIFSKVSIKILA